MKYYNSYLGISQFPRNLPYTPTTLLHDEIQLTAVSATQRELNAANKNNGVLQQNIYCLLTRYIDTMGRGDAPVPVAGAIPPPAASVEEDDEDEVVVTED